MDQVELAEAPSITLGKKPWKVLELSTRQMIRIVPAMSRLDKIDFKIITEDQLETLYGIAFVAISRAQPQLTKDQFDDLPITVQEMMAALPVIARQAGLEIPKDGDATSGEAPAQTAT